MKKTLTATLLLMITVMLLVVPFTSVLAESGYQKVTQDLTVYYSINKTDFFPAFTIPDTYYFKVGSAVDGTEYTGISYMSNSNDLYVKTSDLTAKSVASNDEVSTAEYIISDLTINSGTVLTSVDAFITISNAPSSFTVFGMLSKDNTMYYCIYATYRGNMQDFFLVPASSTNLPSPSLDAVVDHINSQPVEEPSNPDTPTIDGSNDTTAPVGPVNNLLRNILIGVICVLCVIIVFLLFKPARKKQ